jgi:hypothetical protein
VAALGGLALGSDVGRSVAVGWYCTGAFLLAIGLAASSRGPTRLVERPGLRGPVSARGRALRWATRGEQEDSIKLSAVFVVLGFALIALGVGIDPRHRLF